MVNVTLHSILGSYIWNFFLIKGFFYLIYSLPWIDGIHINEYTIFNHRKYEVWNGSSYRSTFIVYLFIFCVNGEQGVCDGYVKSQIRMWSVAMLIFYLNWNWYHLFECMLAMFALIESLLLFGRFEWFFYALNGINCCMGCTNCTLQIAHDKVEVRSWKLQQRSKYFFRILKMCDIWKVCALPHGTSPDFVLMLMPVHCFPHFNINLIVRLIVKSRFCIHLLHLGYLSCYQIQSHSWTIQLFQIQSIPISFRFHWNSMWLKY